MEVLGPRSYKVMINSGVTVRRHVDHIKSRVAGEWALVVPEFGLEGAADADLPENSSEPESETIAAQPAAIRRSSRVRRPPE